MRHDYLSRDYLDHDYLDHDYLDHDYLDNGSSSVAYFTIFFIGEACVDRLVRQNQDRTPNQGGKLRDKSKPLLLALRRFFFQRQVAPSHGCPIDQLLPSDHSGCPRTEENTYELQA